MTEDTMENVLQVNIGTLSAKRIVQPHQLFQLFTPDDDRSRCWVTEDSDIQFVLTPFSALAREKYGSPRHRRPKPYDCMQLAIVSKEYLDMHQLSAVLPYLHLESYVLTVHRREFTDGRHLLNLVYRTRPSMESVPAMDNQLTSHV